MNELDRAYEERNRVVALLAALLPSHRCHTDIDGWDPEWHNCVYIETAMGQLSWHYHDREALLFSHVKESDGPYPYDGHTTDDKYRRIQKLITFLKADD